MLESRAVSPGAQDYCDDVDGPEGTQADSLVPRGILKRLSTSSSTDSLFCRLDLQSLHNMDTPVDTWIDRKQVRFSSSVGRSRVEWQGGKELGEHSLLDVDCITPTAVENLCNLDSTVSSNVSTCKPLLEQGLLGSQDGELLCKPEAHLQEQEAGQQQVHSDVSEHCHSVFLRTAVSGLVFAEQDSGKPVHLEREPEDESHCLASDWLEEHNIHHQKLSEKKTGSSKSSSQVVSPKPKQKLLGIFKKEKDKTAQMQSPQNKEVKIPSFLPKQIEPGNTQNLFQAAVDKTVDKPACVNQEAKPSEMTQVRTVQLTVLQNTPFKETGASAQEGGAAQLPEELSNLKASRGRENNSPKTMFTGEEVRHRISETRMEASHGPQTNTVEENICTEIRSVQESSLPQADSSLLADLLEEDGTYRANPVVIDEDTEDSLTGSVTELQISEIQENMIIVPSSVAFKTQKLKGHVPLPLPRQSSSSPQDGPFKINEPKNNWAEEHIGPRVIAARVGTSSVASNTVMEKTQTSPQKTKSTVFLKSLIVTEKGFVCPDRSPLNSSGIAEDVQSTCHQYQFMPETEAQERPHSPRKSPTPRLKDHDDEVRMSPSKTCHPRVLPRESSSPKRSKLEGSPLKTFPINIDPRMKIAEEHQGKPTPVPRQRQSPSHEAKQTHTATSTDITLPVNLEDRSSSTWQSEKATKNQLGTFARLARSFIPQDYQHYLGPQEKAHVPSFHEEKAAADSPTEGDRPKICSWTTQNKDGDTGQDTTTRAWSLSRASLSSELLISYLYLVKIMIEK